MINEFPTIIRLHQDLKEKKYSASELAHSCIDRIVYAKSARYSQAFITLMSDESYRAAADADSHMAHEDEFNPLTGIPAAIKDVIATKGVRTTAASKILNHYVPPYDATVIEKLKSVRYVPLGKTNCDEFAMGSSNENSAFGPVRNPWDVSRVSGGTSGGSAAAVAEGLAPYALGSDTGGSIRQPAALCGVVGLKPTYGRVSRYGLFATASSLEQIGIIARTVEDVQLVFHAIQGYDPRDAMSIPDASLAVSQPHETTDSLRGITIGLPKEYVGRNWDAHGIEPGVKSAVRSALEEMRTRGAVMKEISLPHAPYALAAYYIINFSEASSNLARYDGIRYGELMNIDKDWQRLNLVQQYTEIRHRGFGREAKRRIMLGTFCLSSGYYEAYYRKAQETRMLIIEDFNRAFSEVDLIACPTSPTVAFRIGDKIGDPVSMYLADIFTVAVNLAGLPAISLPCGFTAAPDDAQSKLPVGLQLIAPRCGEETLFNIGKAYQAFTDYHLQYPSLP